MAVRAVSDAQLADAHDFGYVGLELDAGNLVVREGGEPVLEA